MSVSQLILSVSSLSTSGKKTQDLMASVRREIEVRLGASRVRVVLRTAGKTAVSETQADESEEHPSPSFLFSNAIAVRGVEYGWLEVDFNRPNHSPHVLLTALETISWLLALHAERVRLAEENERLLANLAAIETALSASKIVSRAAGVVAGMRHIPFEQAVGWMQSEAGRTKRPVAEIAERVLLFQENRDRLVTPGAPAA